MFGHDEDGDTIGSAHIINDRGNSDFMNDFFRIYGTVIDIREKENMPYIEGSIILD